ncbi:MAG: hypothetical protein CBB71_19160 [Rhodopirellula sp. TMED11]|nr:MAG: hypothetical protein CBB71_19160 [Rhodopirellula sp. TMED11]
MLGVYRETNGLGQQIDLEIPCLVDSGRFLARKTRLPHPMKGPASGFNLAASNWRGGEPIQPMRISLVG